MTAVVGVAHAYKRAAFMKAVKAQWESRFGTEISDPAVKLFLDEVYEDALAEDLADISAADLAAQIAEFWAWSRDRKPDAIKVRVRPSQIGETADLRRDILEVAGPDRPFLVDSIMGEIGAQGLDVLAMFHPIVPTSEKSAESLIQVHVEQRDAVARKHLEEGVAATLADVEYSTDDWADMRAAMDMAISHLEAADTPASLEEKAEAIEFLRWIRNDHFAFLGCRNYRFDVDEKGHIQNREPDVQKGSGRGILRDPKRQVLRKLSEPSHLTPAIESFLSDSSPLIVAKANIKSRVHRRVYMDYIGVKKYRDDGVVVGEDRFVGLFTADAYDRMARDVPLIRRKVRRVLDRAGKIPGTHSEKKLRHIVENYPRDELFQTDEDDLLAIGLGILHLYDRPRTKIFIRRDRFDRFISVLLFVPRDRYNSKVREQAGEVIRDAFDGRLSAYYPQFGDGPLARVHFIIGLNPYEHPEPDVGELERRIAVLARTWEDDFESLARQTISDGNRPHIRAYEGAFSAGYREAYSPAEAVCDLEKIESLTKDNPLAVRVYHSESDGAGELHLKIYQTGEAVPLSNVMPVLENMGLTVLQESGFEVRRDSNSEDKAQPVVFVHDFEMQRSGASAQADNADVVFEEALLAVLDNRAEDDGFNRLIPQLGVSWRDAAFLRTCARYRQQTGLDPSQAIQEEALAANPDIARCLLELARTKFDPSLALTRDARKEAAEALTADIRARLEAVASIDHDRVLRRILRLIEAILRTNYYQTDAQGRPKAHISLKIASRELEELPLPKPYREIFVWAPNVEGVHIRFGPVARGGLRWSDRRDDFRTEVLGLVKAQQVKNAVIVPVGSKGGFYPKQLPKSGTRDEWLAEGVSAYKTFIRGLLDITDNIEGDTVIHPDNVVSWDEDDPYLVVAADKGTATFSDIANGVATDEYDFWLGDAFASGGSAGYDHKAMGITARGAWESVKRHFRETGKDIQSEPFSVIGVGDMSGDVFGNGMLLSRKIRLLAAFDHRDIFIDPDPVDLEACFAERQRLFETPRSSWQDYDQALISKGGGVFSRAAKTIPLSAEMQALTGIETDRAAPVDLISALLKAPSELLWFGGIGTYVKASDEQHWEVGDKANDALRVDARDVGAQVVGEGANLGFTQAARIEFARKGGRINADFVDNSAGVDTSDHEVNIKILLNPFMRAGDLTRKKRDALLGRMTDKVAEHVLSHNYDQTLAITLAETTAPLDIDAHERFMTGLEAQGRLDRVVEGLPGSEEIRVLKDQGLGLTRPELALLISYAKITLFDALVASSVPDDPHFVDTLHGYFPDDLSGYGDAMATHRLRREIVSTILANDMINLGGPTFVHRAKESTGANVAAVARAFEAGRQIFRFSDLTDRINALDNKAPASVQIDLHEEIIRLLRRQTYWLARRGRGRETDQPAHINDVVTAYREGIDELKAQAHTFISDYERGRVARQAKAFVQAGAPKDLASEIANLRPLTSSSDVVDLALRKDWPLISAARIYHAAGARFQFDRLRGVAGEVSSTQHWDRLAVRRLIEDLYASQQTVAESVMRHAKDVGGSLAKGVEQPDEKWARDLIDSWSIINAEEAGRVDATLTEMDNSGAWSLSKLAIASTQLREMAQNAEP
tara:strand:- start:1277 stop:6169 length:4893 start_codon:yes stop_codon:yes gene_type:complete